MNLSSSRRRRELERFLKFTVVGVIGFTVDFTTFNLLTAVLGVWSVLASALSFSAAVLSNFIWNRYWTYPDSRSKPLREQVGQFYFVNIIGLAIRTPIFALSEGPLTALSHRLIESSKSIGNLTASFQVSSRLVGSNLALALAVIVVLFWNFGVNRFWTYSDVS